MRQDNGKETVTSATGQAQSERAFGGSGKPGLASRISGAKEQESANYKNWNGGDRLRRVAGGILTQLIEDLEDQLGESIRSVAEGQKRIAKIQNRLDRLKQLQLLQQEKM